MRGENPPGVTNILWFNKSKIASLSQDVPSFGPGDTVVVQVKVRGATVSVCKHLKVLLSLNVTGLKLCVYRKISSGVGVERAFQTHSPQIAKLK